MVFLCVVLVLALGFGGCWLEHLRVRDPHWLPARVVKNEPHFSAYSPRCMPSLTPRSDPADTQLSRQEKNESSSLIGWKKVPNGFKETFWNCCGLHNRFTLSHFPSKLDIIQLFASFLHCVYWVGRLILMIILGVLLIFMILFISLFGGFRLFGRFRQFLDLSILVNFVDKCHNFCSLSI